MSERERMRDSSTGANAAWIGGVVLILLGVVLWLQNTGLLPLGGNWWAVFILIPAIILLGAAWMAYRESGAFTSRVAGPMIGALFPLAVAMIFFLVLDWGVVWPIFPIIAGIGFLLRGIARS